MPKDENKKTEGCGERMGVYVNHLAIGHNMSEIILEFSQVFDEAKTCPQTRLITSPTHLRSFHSLMADTIERYEDEFGPLPAGDLVEKGH